MPQEKYKICLMFEWGGGCIWCKNDLARLKFSVGPIEDILPLSDTVKNRLETLTEWHDKALDWSNPAGPSPWGTEDFILFNKTAMEILRIIQSELGPSFSIGYRPLGQ